MPTKKQIYSNRKKTGSKQRSRKLASNNLNILASEHPHPATIIQRARLDIGSLAARDILQLQRTIGNRAVGRLLTETEKGFDFQSQSAQRQIELGEENQLGLPGNLKAGIESLSGMPMDDVKVQYNSSRPAEVQALAYTQGNNIYVGPGQEKHLPHEAWHVAQQKQGRVTSANVQAKGASINDDPGLEREADQMGALASGANYFEGIQTADQLPVSQSVQREVMQRKKVPTNFGEFETTKFAEADGRGVEITLKFNPDETKVDAKKIALSQSIRTTTATGAAYALDPNIASKMVGSGKSGEGYYIDTLSGANNPLYGERNTLGAGQDLKDTPQSANTTTDPTELGKNTNYDLGHCYKDKPADANKKKHPAGLWDKPRGGKNKGESKIFETAALAIEGTDAGKYYGSVKWGYKMEGTNAAPTVTKSDIEEASKGTPTANFIEPAKLWNAGKTPGTIQVTADPEATVLKGDASGTEKLAKDKKLKQLETNMWGTDPAIKAEVLKADGSGSGKIIYIKVSDVKDMGDGSATKDLPV